LMPEEASAMWRPALALAGLARRAVVVADLRRAALARLAFRAGAVALRFDRHTRADGLTSIARGYTGAELAGLCAAAGVRAEVAELPWYRVGAWWPVGRTA
ncbi:MAG TPA: hypothetical protein VJ773_04640, partial [Gemmatimonadales bacterium]|nr:hypothetical protein [Gemmatimonadales bacterium]